MAKAEESLLSAEDDFANERYNSCARSSYALFQAAVAALIQENIRPARGRWEHRFVHSQFAGQLVYRRKVYPNSLRATLREIYGLRRKADYEANSVTSDQARQALQAARQVVSLVRERTR